MLTAKDAVNTRKYLCIILQYTGWDTSDIDWDDACNYLSKEFDTSVEATAWAEQKIETFENESMGGIPIVYTYQIPPPDYNGTW